MFLKKLDLLHMSISMATADLSSETLTGEAILNKYIDAVGGKASLEKIKCRISKTTTSIPEKKKNIKTTTFMKRPDKFYAVSQFKVLGKTVKSEGGRNGDVVWQIIPGAIRSKYRILSGKEKELKLADQFFNNADLSWKDFYKNINLVGEEEIDGKRCYKVAFSPLDGAGKETICFFEKETFLIQKTVRDIFIQDKLTHAEIFLSDYKYAGNIMVPHTLKRISRGENDIIITLDSLESNIDIPDSKFELPKKIKALAKKQGLI